jgi:ribosomal protein S18 acetylase RimI-like enzyme
MSDLPESLFANPVWHALHTKHRKFAAFTKDACRYSSAVAPFAATGAQNANAMKQVCSLLVPGESVWIIGEEYAQIPELVCGQSLECLQMVLAEELEVPGPAIEIVRLSDENASEMVALTALAFPGFFRERTCEMGAYYGVRSSSGELIAMSGERLKLDGYTEISGVCTHPSYRGQGFAANLMWRLVHEHRREGVVSWLHVASANHRAIELYLRMGFVEIRKITVRRVALNLSN